MPPIPPDAATGVVNEWLTSAGEVSRLIAFVIALYTSATYWSQPYHTSKLSGHDWVKELMHGHPDRIHTELGVRLHVFILLLVQLREMGYGDGKYVKLEEQLAIFLYGCVTGLSVRHLGERFQRSNETIAKYFRRMCNALSSPMFYNEFVRLPSTADPVPRYIRRNPKLWPYFKNCLGAMDGSHIACTPSAEDRANTRNRKGFLSQNILAVCSFSLRFIYVLAGWEGSVTDSFLYSDARFTDFRIPQGYYYLGDAGFPLCESVVIPYRGVRYHLNEWARGNSKPQNKEELFNLRHAQARNVIERIFGVIKKKWIVLVLPPKYDMDLQARLPCALAALHNFILDSDTEEHIEADIVDPIPGAHVDPEELFTTQGTLSAERRTAEESEEGRRLREDIAQAMWDDYVVIRDQRTLEEELSMEEDDDEDVEMGEN